jgi:enoyl-CoA hydratase/carnithine racemase
MRVVVVRGAGERAFASGADINQLDGQMRRATAGPDSPDGRRRGRWRAISP